MGDLSGRAFRVLIAYLIPGFILVLGATPFIPALQAWLAIDGPEAGAHARLSYVLLVSFTLGMILHVVRWAVIDSFHIRTGLRRPTWNDATLSDHLAAYETLVELYYGYYEFCANTSLAILGAYVPLRISGQLAAYLAWWSDLVIILLVGILLAGSRNTLRNYYRRVDLLLGPTPERSTVMTNGGGHHEEGAPSPTTRKDHPKVTPESKTPKKAAEGGEVRTSKPRS
jgi:hypothetical protein